MHTILPIIVYLRSRNFGESKKEKKNIFDYALYQTSLSITISR